MLSTLEPGLSGARLVADVAGALDLYRDPLFWWFPVGASLVSVAAFALFAAPLTWLAMVDHPALRRYRIQPRRARDDDARRIILPSLRLWAINNALQLALIVLAWPLLRLTSVHAGPPPPAWIVGAQVLLFVYLHDLRATAQSIHAR
ncbi:MAG: hypothetical protein H6713_15975 [Myxococcales bacterium]|nr:hypothetical protein [Myxococcales bacterium]MCB9751473.1 hypothetical protein [Myxococcales bacterium]